MCRLDSRATVSWNQSSSLLKMQPSARSRHLNRHPGLFWGTPLPTSALGFVQEHLLPPKGSSGGVWNKWRWKLKWLVSSYFFLFYFYRCVYNAGSNAFPNLLWKSRKLKSIVLFIIKRRFSFMVRVHKGKIVFLNALKKALKKHTLNCC